jgi:hypothetical protein
VYGDCDGFGAINVSVEKTEAQRFATIRKAIDSIASLSSQAISLEVNHLFEVKRSEELLIAGEEKLSALAVDRAKRIHHDRCRALQRIASFARLVMIEASGDLRISESTTHTGLDVSERIAVSEVLGMVDR